MMIKNNKDLNKKIKKLKKYVAKLSKKRSKFSKIDKEDLPNKKGVYVLINKGKPVYVGSCGVKGNGERTLRTRIWDNHICGNFDNSSLKRKIKKFEKINSSKKVKEYILQNFYVEYLEILSNKIITSLEHFLIAIYKPKYND